MISIIIPVFNQHDMTEDCLLTLLDNTQDCEIIVVDNGSIPPIKPPFSGFTEIRVIRNEENKGFPVAVNQGVREAKGDIVILLNNDVIVTPGWAEKLRARLDQKRIKIEKTTKDDGMSYDLHEIPDGYAFSIVGPVTNYAAGLQRVQIGNYENKEELNKEAAYLAEECEGDIEEVNWIIGFCMAFKKSLVDELGPFDESLWPCSGEEIDFCLRARAAGHRVGIAQDVYVHHEGSKTFSDMDAAGALKYAEVVSRNDAHLAEKWGEGFWQRQAIADRPTIEVAPGEAIKLNLGSGYAPQAGYVNIDNRAEATPDMVLDVLDGLPWPDNSVDEVRAFDFLEHIPLGQTVSVIEEIYRVLKPGGLFESFTPDAEHGQGAFQDPHHVSFWVENSWCYFSDPKLRVQYNIKADLDLKSIMRIDGGRRESHLHVIARARK